MKSVKSMSDPVKIAYLWDRENFEKVFDLSYKYLFDHSSKRYIGWFFIALLQFGVVAAIKKGFFGLLLFSSLVLLYWYYGKKVIAKKRAEKVFEHSPFKNKTIHILAKEDGLDISGREGNTFWQWNEIDEVISLGDDLLIHKYPHFHYIPASAFTSIEEKNRFKKLAKKHAKLRP